MGHPVYIVINIVLLLLVFQQSRELKPCQTGINMPCALAKAYYKLKALHDINLCPLLGRCILTLKPRLHSPFSTRLGNSTYSKLFCDKIEGGYTCSQATSNICRRLCKVQLDECSVLVVLWHNLSWLHAQNSVFQMATISK